MLQTHNLTVSRPEGWTFLLWLRLCCYSVFHQSNAGPHTWWDTHSPELSVLIEDFFFFFLKEEVKIMTIQDCFLFLFFFLYCFHPRSWFFVFSRFRSRQARVQPQRHETAAGLQEEGVARRLLREHEAARGNAPLRYAWLSLRGEKEPELKWSRDVIYDGSCPGKCFID